MWYPHEYIYRSVLISQNRIKSKVREFDHQERIDIFYLHNVILSATDFLLTPCLLKDGIFMHLVFDLKFLQIDEFAVFSNFNERTEKRK